MICPFGISCSFLGSQSSPLSEGRLGVGKLSGGQQLGYLATNLKNKSYRKEGIVF